MSNPLDDPRILRGMERQLQLRRARLDAGEKLIGWKVGFGAPASLERLRLAAPLVGFLTDKTLLPSGAEVSIDSWTKPALEPEIAVYMDRDLPGDADRPTARAAIAALGPAIELADLDFPPEDVEAILAGNIYNRHVILGEADPSRAGCRLEELVGRVSHNARELPAVADLQALTGDIVDLVRHVAAVLSGLGEGLHAGDVMIAGSVISPLWVGQSDRVTYTLDPLGPLEISFR